MKSFLDRLKNEILVFDGSMGYMLQRLGLKGGECNELWNAEHGREVAEVYRLYKEAGSDVIQTNTFQGGRLQLNKYSLGDRTYELSFESARLAREVMGNDGFVAASIGPCGKLLEPLGDLSFEAAYKNFSEQIKAVADGGADIISFETFTDAAELRIALLAAKETVKLPVVCSLAFEANGKTLMGTDPYTAACTLRSLGADIVGTNCSFGPAHQLEIIKHMSGSGGFYLSAKPNAGLPDIIDGKTVYREVAESFAALTAEFVKYGVRLIGGCCGTTPEFIKAIKDEVSKIKVSEIAKPSETPFLTSGVKMRSFEGMEKLTPVKLFPEDPVSLQSLINEGIGAFGDRVMELMEEDFDSVLVKYGPEDDGNFLAAAVELAQNYLKEPFIFEVTSAGALEKALRIYKGRAGIIIGEKYGAAAAELADRYGSQKIG